MKHHIYIPPDGPPTHCETCPCQSVKQMCHVVHPDDLNSDWAYCREVSKIRFFFYTVLGLDEEKKDSEAELYI